MEEDLLEFHQFKDAILQAGARRGKTAAMEHFHIPKLELFQSFGRSIRNSGALIQYTVDVSEHLLITHCKDPFTCMNRQKAKFTQQIVILLDRHESMRQFNLYSLLLAKGIGLTNSLFLESEDDPRYVDPTLDWVQRVAPEDAHHIQGPRSFKNHFLKGIISEDATMAFHVTVKPDFADKSANYIADTYTLPDFAERLQAFIATIPVDNSHLSSCLLKGWLKFRLQLQSRLNPRKLMPSQQVQALPPSEEYPSGKCDVVLVHYTTPSGDVSESYSQMTFSLKCISYFPVSVVAQVQAVFNFSSRGRPLPPEHSHLLLYVQYFTFSALPADQPELRMYTVRRMFVDNLEGGRSCVSAIISLLDVIHAVELIPKYGAAANREVTSATCLELYDEFYLNNFSDKEWHHTVHNDYL